MHTIFLLHNAKYLKDENFCSFLQFIPYPQMFFLQTVYRAMHSYTGNSHNQEFFAQMPVRPYILLQYITVKDFSLKYFVQCGKLHIVVWNHTECFTK